jgi:glycosyltransferase involved in cell wall biosynthesis
MLQLLSERGEQVDVLTYHEGEDVFYDNVTITRIACLPFIKNIPAGFSLKKIICDVILLVWALAMASRKNYQLIHAIEESVFIALLLKFLFKVPFVYDMDSSLAQQMTEQYRWLSPLMPFFALFEGFAVRYAEAIVPVCDSLAEDAAKYDPRKIFILHDVSLLEDPELPPSEDLKAELGITGSMLMYVGNLQPYQGIDLLLESFAQALPSVPDASLVVIGGADANIEKYRALSAQLELGNSVHFVGPRPLEKLSMYLAQADILVSPRIKGKNTPMKVYSYLHSGKPLLATDMPTHTQVVDHKTAALAAPEATAYAEKMIALLQSEEMRARLGRAGHDLIEQKYSYPVFHKRFNQIYDWLSFRFAPSGNQRRIKYSNSSL